MKWRKALAVVGLALFLVGMVFNIVTSERASEYEEALKDRPDDGLGGYLGTGSEGTVPCVISPAKGTSTVTIDTSFPLTVTVFPLWTVKDVGPHYYCHSDVRVVAPAFDPPKESQTFDLPDQQGNQQKSFTFVLVPKKAGNQLIKVFSEEEEEDQYMLHYTVKRSELLPAWMNPFISPVLSVFGSMLTIPWWIERREKKREEARKKADEEAKKKQEKPLIIT